MRRKSHNVGVFYIKPGTNEINVCANIHLGGEIYTRSCEYIRAEKILKQMKVLYPEIDYYISQHVSNCKAMSSNCCVGQGKTNKEHLKEIIRILEL